LGSWEAKKREAGKPGSWENNYLTDPIAFSVFQNSIIPLFLFGICRMVTFVKTL
jgi:hypothetical protein